MSVRYICQERVCTVPGSIEDVVETHVSCIETERTSRIAEADLI